ncbi:MAG: hypothetical protein WA432_03030 [Candidatus Babeliaceae bacterium]
MRVLKKIFLVSSLVLFTVLSAQNSEEINSFNQAIDASQAADQSTVKSALSLFGYQLTSPIGIAGCPLMTSKGIAAAAQRGYSIFTYKTIRTSSCPAFSSHLYYVDVQNQLTLQDIGATYLSKEQELASYEHLAITNSFGLNCLEPEQVINDIVQARAALTEGQLLIVSIYGSGKNTEEQIKDFVNAARMVQRGGAHIIEANLSCPNLSNDHMIYQQPALVHAICKAITTALPQIPLIIKVGIFENHEQMKQVLLAASQGGARGICGINSVPIKVIDADHQPIFGHDRCLSGLSGSPLRELAIQFVRDARAIIDEQKLNMMICATGGVTQPEHFDVLLAAGADIALSAAGAMWNERLALDYHQSQKLKNCYVCSKSLSIIGLSGAGKS